MDDPISAMLLDDSEICELERLAQPPSREFLLQLLRRPGSSLAHLDEAAVLRRAAIAVRHMLAYRRAQHPHYEGAALYFRAARGPAQQGTPAFCRYLGRATQVIEVDAVHLNMTGPKAMKTIAAVLRETMPPGDNDGL